MKFCRTPLFTVASALVASTAAQTFQRLGGCPTLGCIFPPDQAEFLPGAYFDVRIEVHAPVNGSQAQTQPPDEKFVFTIAKKGAYGSPKPAAKYFSIEEPKLEKWNFTWYEDLFAKDKKTPSLVNVTAKAYRKVALYDPGEYTATLTYYGSQKTVAEWIVRDVTKPRKAKNVIMFIGDGMPVTAISAARVLAHKTTNGKYKTRLAIDGFPVIGLQSPISMDSIITDSANSATALYTGHKSTVNALGVYADSSKSPFDDPKVETIAELFQRREGGKVGIVSTAFVADATLAALTAHTRDRGQYGAVVDSFLNGITNYTWTNWTGPDVLFGGGAEQFYNSSKGGVTYMDKDYYTEFSKKGYQLVNDKTTLLAAKNDQKTLGIFQVSNIMPWLDRNIYKDNLKNRKNSPDGNKQDALNLPGLKDMTLKAIDILSERSEGKGWFLMSEAASIDKQFHALDYHRSLGELLELDNTVNATIAHLKATGQLEDTLIIVTADHGHGFDVAGSVDTQYLEAQTTDRAKRSAVGVYQESGLSQYCNTGNLSYPDGDVFPSNWSPRYTFFQGMMATPDHREDYKVPTDGPRKPAINLTETQDFYVNYKDAVSGFVVNGTLPTGESQGVHSLTDVPVYAKGPCQELFGGVYDNVHIFFGIAECLGLGSTKKP